MSYDYEETPTGLVGTIDDRRTIVKANTTILPTGSGPWTVSITFPFLKHITAILNAEVISTSPKTCHDGIQRHSISGNVVGYTICGIVQGCTLCFEAVAIGW
jgi:hypothetical protein